jgi:tRNA-dihydrouridine synthase A
MMDWTDVHYRQLARLMSRHTWLYTEMVVDSTLIHNPEIDRFLWFPPEQRPIVCQLGGSNPAHLARAAEMVGRYGYDEINLNCGCPRCKGNAWGMGDHGTETRSCMCTCPALRSYLHALTITRAWPCPQ